MAEWDKSMQRCLRLLAAKEPLPVEAVEAAMLAMMSGQATDTQVGALLVGIETNGQATPEVVRAFARLMLQFAVPFEAVGKDPAAPVVDIVGTGGDGMDSFNVSTTAGLVMAACGVTVAKHGNRSSSGNVGSADLLEALGARIDLDAAATGRVLSECGFAFLFARMFHPAMKNVAGVRKQLGVRTVFNLLGPLTNPAQPQRQVIGVGQARLGPLFAELIRQQGKAHCWVVHSTDGMDELSPSAATKVWEVIGDTVTEREVSPADFGLATHDLAAVQGGSAEERAQWFRDVLDGAPGPIRDFIVLNAAAGLFVAGVAPDLMAASTMAQAALDSGAAKRLADAYIAATNSSPGKDQKPGAGAGASTAPGREEGTCRYVTQSGIRVTRETTLINAQHEVESLIDALDERLGCLFASSYEYPGRYTRWDMGFVDPPVVITSCQRRFSVEALNERGVVLLAPIRGALEACEAVASVAADPAAPRLLEGEIREVEGRFSEEERSRQPSVFSVIRSLIALFFSDVDASLGLYGAFGYDLAFAFEPVTLKRPRDDGQRDIVLYIPDRLLQVDHSLQLAWVSEYDFGFGDAETAGLPREGQAVPFVSDPAPPPRACDHEPGQYADKVRLAKEKFKVGDLFETVLSQTFYEPCPAPPSELFRRIRDSNPAPYGFIINLGAREHLVGASPEMYVRVQGQRLETCPISGTIKRGQDAVSDAKQILELLNSTKDESELTMCTDVDRNDKSRICKPGSVRVIGRRQIEMYSRLIHTVDHVEGYLQDGYDALDAFLCHTWAVTVTGAPKPWAMQFVEDQEESNRHWYAGAVGVLGFDGNMNTGLTLRTIQIRDGTANVRAGATLLWDSDPDAEEAETRLKASAFLDALRRPRDPKKAAGPGGSSGGGGGGHLVAQVGTGFRVVIVDHQDSFVHTLGNYVRQTGAHVTTLRAGFDEAMLDGQGYDMALLSPGPGCPKDFKVSETIAMLLERGIAIFGVCLGLQGLVEHYGGTLDVLPQPLHGKPGTISVTAEDSYTFAGLDPAFTAARYHSLYAVRDTLPAVLRATAVAEDGIVMAVEHTELPIAAVQFHPESILTGHANGLSILSNAIRHFRSLSQ